jgi:hypothetical protein
MIDSFKIGDIVNDNMDTLDESRSVINTNNNEDAIKKYSKMMKMIKVVKKIEIYNICIFPIISSNLVN